MNETRRLVEFVVGLKYDDLPAGVIAKAKELILDQLGCQLACSTKPWSKAVYKYVRDKSGGKQESTVINYGLRTTVEDAAFVNATFGHGFEIDDTDLVSALHPGCVVIPGALAIGEREMVSGREFILAVVAGYDVASRIGAAARLAIKRWFHPTALFGPFGTAAAVAKLMGFSQEQMSNTLGIAGSECSGLMEYSETGGSVKRLHAGFAAASGVRAVLVAERGITGPSTVIEGKKGFCQAVTNEYFIDEITRDLGKEFRMMWTGVKPYCCCAGQHSALDAFSEILKAHPFEPKDVKEILVGAPQHLVNIVGRIVEPEDIISMQFSGSCGIALRLLKGGNEFKHYSEDNLWDPKLRAMAKRVKWGRDEELEKETQVSSQIGSSSRVTVKLVNGATYSAKVDFPTGSPQNPVSKKWLEGKFRGLAGVALEPDRAEEILKTVNQLEKLDNIQKLASLLVANGGQVC